MTEQTPEDVGRGAARGYSWPPFQPGHTLSVRHGAYSPRLVDPLAGEIVQGLLDDPAIAYLQAPRYRLALWALARAEAQVQLLVEWIGRHAEEMGDGVGDLADEPTRAAYLLLHRAEARADRSRARLGLDPLSAARLGRDVVATGVDMARLLSGQVRLPGDEEGAGDELSD